MNRHLTVFFISQMILEPTVVREEPVTYLSVDNSERGKKNHAGRKARWIRRSRGDSRALDPTVAYFCQRCRLINPQAPA